MLHYMGVRRTPGHADRSARYDRERDLPRMIAIWPSDLTRAGEGPEQHRVLVRAILTALRRERRKARSGDVGYDAIRHRNLLWALRCELAFASCRWPAPRTSCSDA